MSQKKRTRIIKLQRIEKQSEAAEAGWLSLSDCKAILCEDGAEYSEEEVVLIRKVLYALAEVDYTYHASQNKQPTLIIPLKATSTDHAQQESHSLCPRLYRRTG